MCIHSICIPNRISVKQIITLKPFFCLLCLLLLSSNIVIFFLPCCKMYTSVHSEKIFMSPS